MFHPLKHCVDADSHNCRLFQSLHQVDSQAVASNSLILAQSDYNVLSELMTPYCHTCLEPFLTFGDLQTVRTRLVYLVRAHHILIAS